MAHGTRLAAVLAAMAALAPAVPAADEGPKVILEVTCTSEAIKAAVQARREELVACYRKELARRPQLSATSMFEWTVRADGRVSAPTADDMSAELDDPDLRDCVLGRIAAWSLPRPAGGPVGVTMVAAFTPGLTAAREGAPGKVDPAAIRKVVQAHSADILGCYEPRLASNPSLQGKVTLRFVIEADGAVRGEPEVADPTTLRDRELQACMKARVASWRFPRPEGGGTAVVTYPWVFRASTGKTP